MEVDTVYGGGSDMIDLLEKLWIPGSSSSNHETMLNFDQEKYQVRMDNIKSGNGNDTGEEDFEINRCQLEKKRRLSPEQVEYLEKSFEIDAKLEPQRKMELAKELGLQPRQVAIWFQNRRVRYKTKHLEKEYDSLKASYDQLLLDFDSLTKERDNLQNEVKVLSKKLKERDEGEHVTPINLLQSDKEMTKMEIREVNKTQLVVVPQTNKQLAEDANSAKTNILESESSHCTDGNHSSLMEDPTYHQPDFLMVEYNGFDDPNASSYNFSLVDEEPLWSMLY